MNRQVIYMYSQAFIDCDCGKNMVLSQITYGDKTYTGECSCGLKFNLLNGKLFNSPQKEN